MTVRTALAKSKNLATIRIVQLLGIPVVREWAARFGITPDKQPDNLTISLGAGSVTPMQMVRAYAAFANGGFGVTPRFIERITDPHGKVLFEAPPLPAAPGEDQRILPARNAFVMDSLLNEVARTGTGAKAQATLKRADIYGKTGTTNDAVDTWFAGFQPKVAAVVWVGHDDNTSLGAREFGNTVALPIWIDYMRTAVKDQPVVALKTPDGLAERDGEWYYDNLVDGGYVAQLGMEPGSGTPSVVMAARPGDPAAVALPEGATALPPTGLPSPALPVGVTPIGLPAATDKPASASQGVTVDPLERLPPSIR
jgi:penicillin-binding protein 1A